MPNNGNTDYSDAAQLTVDLVDHGHTPDRVSEAVLETLIEMSADSQINIWRREPGLGKESLAALYRMYDTGAGYRRPRLYGAYETGSLERTPARTKHASG